MPVVSDELLEMFKQSIGDLNSDFTQDSYYEGFLIQALADLTTDDISKKQINSQLGQYCTVLYAEALMNKTDIATNPTISLIRNKLSVLSKGEKFD